MKLHQTAAGCIEQNYASAEGSTAWPLSAALTRPEFGYVKAAHRVREIRDFSESAVAGLDRGSVEVFVLYSRQWDSPGNLLRNPIITKIYPAVPGKVSNGQNNLPYAECRIMPSSA